MLRNIYTCDCFLDIACYSLEMNDGFVDFQRKCTKEKTYKDIFIIRDCTDRRQSCFFLIKFVICCKEFVDFQIDLFVKEESFPLRSVTCNYAFAAKNVETPNIDFDYDDNFMHVCYDSDSGSDDNDSDKKQINCFESLGSLSLKF